MWPIPSSICSYYVDKNYHSKLKLKNECKMVNRNVYLFTKIICANNYAYYIREKYIKIYLSNKNCLLKQQQKYTIKTTRLLKQKMQFNATIKHFAFPPRPVLRIFLTIILSSHNGIMKVKLLLSLFLFLKAELFPTISSVL